MSWFSSINVKKINSLNLQGNLTNQLNEQKARSNTWCAPSKAKNTADQNAPSRQIGKAFNNLNICSPAREKAWVGVKKINAENGQANEANQASSQDARASSRGGSALAKNWLSQNAGNVQIGSAYNNINVWTKAKKNDVSVSEINAANQQTNLANQVNSQNAVSSTRGWDPAINGARQTASNYQNGSAYNNINITA